MDNSVKALRAKEIIHNPLFRDIIKEMSETYFNDWAMSETVEEREEIHAKMQVLKDVIEELNGIIAMHTGDGDA